MPELPEVEVVRRGLETWAVGRTIQDVSVHDERALKRHASGAEDFARRLRGRTLQAAVRRGKFLWLPLTAATMPDAAPSAPAQASPESQNPQSAGESREALVAHLGMSGQILMEEPSAPAESHLRVALTLSPSAGVFSGPTEEAAPDQLRFVDQRLFGGLRIAPLVPTSDGLPGGLGSDEALVPADAAHIARDVLDPAVTGASLRQAWKRRRTAVKAALLDQQGLSGVGNIYADEALWRARLHYLTPVAGLGAAKLDALLQHLRDVMTESLAQGGTSFDSLYVNVNGASGYFSRSLNVYGRAGRPCPRCAAEGKPGRIVRESWGGRSSYRCRFCQRRPRSLTTAGA